MTATSQIFAAAFALLITAVSFQQTVTVPLAVASPVTPVAIA